MCSRGWAICGVKGELTAAAGIQVLSLSVVSLLVTEYCDNKCCKCMAPVRILTPGCIQGLTLIAGTKRSFGKKKKKKKKYPELTRHALRWFSTPITPMWVFHFDHKHKRTQRGTYDGTRTLVARQNYQQRKLFTNKSGWQAKNGNPVRSSARVTGEHRHSAVIVVRYLFLL